MPGVSYHLVEEQLRPTYPEVPRDVWVAYTVLFISIGLEAFSFRTAVREANKSRESKSIPRYVRDSRQPELPVVLLEDFGALIGLGFALAGIFLASVTGDGRWDGMGTVAIGPCWSSLRCSCPTRWPRC